MTASRGQRIAAGTTVVLSLVTAGYQYNKAEMAEMRSLIRIELNQLKLEQQQKSLEGKQVELRQSKDDISVAQEDQRRITRGNEKLLAENARLRESQDQLSDALRQQRVQIAALVPPSTLPATATATGTAPTTASAALTAPSKPLIYLQFPLDDKDARRRADGLVTALGRLNYAVPSPEARPMKEFLDSNDIRHYQDTEGQLLQSIKTTLEKEQLRNVRLVDLGKAKSPQQRNTVEVWLAASPKAQAAPASLPASASSAASPAPLPAPASAPAVPTTASPAVVDPPPTDRVVLSKSLRPGTSAKVDNAFQVSLTYLTEISADIKIQALQGGNPINILDFKEGGARPFEINNRKYVLKLLDVRPPRGKIEITELAPR